MEKIYQKKLGELRGEMIEKIVEVVREKGHTLGNRKELCTYYGNDDDRVEICGGDYVWDLQISEANYISAWVETSDSSYHLYELPTDDICSILEFIISMDKETAELCRKWRHEE